MNSSFPLFLNSWQVWKYLTNTPTSATISRSQGEGLASDDTPQCPCCVAAPLLPGDFPALVAFEFLTVSLHIWALLVLTQQIRILQSSTYIDKNESRQPPQQPGQLMELDGGHGEG